MASIYQRGNRLWATVKNEKGAWVKLPCPFNVGQEKEALRYAQSRQKLMDQRRAQGADAPMTVKRYAQAWVKERIELGIRSAEDDWTRLERHALPHLGQLIMTEVRPTDVRNMVRELRKAGKLAPRSIIHIYAIVRTMFGCAEADEVVAANPCKLRRGELPKKADADPEWRAAATYTVDEVERLIADENLAVERRVLYALKAIAALRHGEAAALRWRHYDHTMQPLGGLTIAAAYDSDAGELKETKTGETRRVPVHPALAKILAAWKLSHWERIYGRAPTVDDFIVPVRTMTPLSNVDAARAMREDLLSLGLRVEAGQGNRSRGGHDLRAWFITTCQEHGAHRDLLRVVTHKAPGDVVSGYTRASWPALCTEVAKLRISAESRGEVLPLGTMLVTTERMARNRWRKEATPAGFEDLPSPSSTRENGTTAGKQRSDTHSHGVSRAEVVTRLVTDLAVAVLDGNGARATELATQLGEVDDLTLRRGRRRRQVR